MSKAKYGTKWKKHSEHRQEHEEHKEHWRHGMDLGGGSPDKLTKSKGTTHAKIQTKLMSG